MPIVLPPALVFALGFLGVAVIAKVVTKELRRVKENLQGREAPVGEDIPVLRRDPKSGIYRPE
jgi:hypothetical protein